LAWRTSKRQLHWVISPGNPNVVEDENVMTLLAHYIVVIWAVRNKKACAIGDINIIHVMVTANDVMELIKERAANYPILVCVMMQICLSEIMLVLQEAKSKADAVLYKSM
jgi:hypothetical protein